MAGRNLTRTLIDASQVAAVIAFLASPLSVRSTASRSHAGAGLRELSAIRLADARPQPVPPAGACLQSRYWRTLQMIPIAG